MAEQPPRVSGGGEQPPAFQLPPGTHRLPITFLAGWLDDRPLTMADLENEQAYLGKQDFELIVNA